MKHVRTVLVLGVLLAGGFAKAGGTEVTNPWPLDVPAITLTGDSAKQMASSIASLDETFAKTLTLSSAECVQNGFGGQPVVYSGSISHNTQVKQLDAAAAKALCATLEEAGVMKFQPPNPSGEFLLQTKMIQCQTPPAERCDIWL